MKHGTNINGGNNTLYAYYWWLSLEERQGQSCSVGRLEMI